MQCNKAFRFARLLETRFRKSHLPEFIPMERFELHLVMSPISGENLMARKYSRSTSREVKNEMHRYKRGKAKLGKGGRVKSRKQAIAIALSKARKKGKKAPKRKLYKKFQLCAYKDDVLSLLSLT